MKKIIVICLISLLVIYGAVGYSIHYYQTQIVNSTLDISQISPPKEDIRAIVSKDFDPFLYNKAFINIVLFGIDSRDGLEGTRSDTIMIGTYDIDNKQLKVTSILRDTYVYIPGNDYDKINHSYMYGGAELAIKTINANFGLNIEDYVTIDFVGLKKVVDHIGGVEIELTKKEANYLNRWGFKSLKAGKQLMNGAETLAYSRIRKIDSDFNRTDRQRKVLQSLFHNLSKVNVLDIPKISNYIIPYLETSLTTKEMMSFATSVLNKEIKDISELRLPVKEYARGANMGRSYIVPYSLEDNVKIFYEFIFGEYKTVDQVHKISEQIKMNTKYVKKYRILY